MPLKSMQEFQESSYLSSGNMAYIESLYEQFLQNPNQVPANWRNYFQSLPKVNGADQDVSHEQIRRHFLQLVNHPRMMSAASTDVAYEHKLASITRLIDAYRRYGHLAAKLNPLGGERLPVPQLSLATYGFTHADLSQQFQLPELTGTPSASLQNICDTLNKIYCHHIGVEYMHLNNVAEINWWREKFEAARGHIKFSVEEKKQILQLLIAADGLEKYLGSKYVGQKRFSLEGGDSFIPLLHRITQQAGSNNVKSCIIGMAHRGRLNVLVNIMGQSPSELFKEFEGKQDYGLTSGDVKYHLGFSSDVNTPGGTTHLSLAFNPSHLEVISPVIMGSVRARQDQVQDEKRHSVMAIIVHGDAAVAGQGIVMETLNMSQTRAYYIGGAIHIVINNQLGFTTSDTHDARSSIYCTDIAKTIDAPILHVNGDDPEAVVLAAQLALEYRIRFQKDVFIDLVCYRLHGHNEADEPRATQPVMYGQIKQHASTREIYTKQLIEEGILTQQEIDQSIKGYRDKLDQGEGIVNIVAAGRTYEREENWKKYLKEDWRDSANTGYDKGKLVALAKQLLALPKDFTLQRQVGHVVSTREKMASEEQPIDWGFAENLAYACLIEQGISVRMSGQDCRRGTFAHRHAVLHDQKTGQIYTPLHHIKNAKGRFEIYDSLLSEEGVVGFEFGYAKTEPDNLVIWEAQFGDFANGAQVIIDQFISSSWQKWRRLCNLVMLLPHGYEGMGPEHSSARLERYLQLCAQNNIQVCVPTTPAQIFHLLRRQVLRAFHAPLIVMSPKSLLRHQLAVSTLNDLANGMFQLVMPEVDKEIVSNNVQRVVICCGKVYYDLLKKRREGKQNDVAILRIEQLYPFPYDELRKQMALYKQAKEVIWCQEEPKNQGAWFISAHRIRECIHEGQTLQYVGRKASASSAVGYAELHNQQQKELVEKALSTSEKT